MQITTLLKTIYDIKKITAPDKTFCNLKNYNSKQKISISLKKTLPKFDLLMAGFPCHHLVLWVNKKV